MNIPQKKYPRIDVSSDLAATFTCPNCGLSKLKDVSRFFHPEKTTRVKCRCNCTHSFRVLLGRQNSPENGTVPPGRQIRWVVKRQRSTYKKDAVLLLSLFIIVLISVFYLFFDVPANNASPKASYLTGTKTGDVIRSVYDSRD